MKTVTAVEFEGFMGKLFVENSVAFNWIFEETPFVEFTEKSHDEIITILKKELANIKETTDSEDIDDFRAEIVDMLAQCEYPHSFIRKIDEEILNAFFLNNHSIPVRAFPKNEKAPKLAKQKIKGTVYHNGTYFDCDILSIGEEHSIIEYNQRHFKIANEIIDVEMINVQEAINNFIPKEPQESTNIGLAFHDNFGLVEIHEYTRDEFGNEMVEILPLNTNPFIDPTSTMAPFYEGTEDDEYLRDNIPSLGSVKPTSVYISELITFDSLRKDIRDKVLRIMADSNEFKQYSCFSIYDSIPTATNDSDEKKTIYDTLASLEENVIVIENLPRRKLEVNPMAAYQPRINKSIRSAYKKATINGKIDKTKLVLPKIPTNSLEVTPIGNSMNINGVTTYKANITHVQETYKTRFKNSWKEYKMAPKVLTFAVDTFKLKVISASMLHETNIPMEFETTVKDKKFILDLSRSVQESVKMLDDATKVTYEEIIYNKPKHKKYFDVVATARDLRYKYTDPVTNETFTPDSICANNEDLAIELGYPVDLILASRNLKKQSIYTSQKDTYTPKQVFIDNCIAEIKSNLQVTDITYKYSGKMDDPNHSITAVITKDNKQHVVKILKKSGQYNVSGKMSILAKELFINLTKTVFTKAEDLNLYGGF